MTTAAEGALLWEPTPEVIENANLTRYRRWLADRRGLHLDDYDSLWRWSVTALEDFWASLFEYFEVRHTGAWRTPLAARTMPGAAWFPRTIPNISDSPTT